eukprot:6189073-Pleurochrysis_carterae.AAC.1
MSSVANRALAPKPPSPPRYRLGRGQSSVAETLPDRCSDGTLLSAAATQAAVQPWTVDADGSASTAPAAL